MGHKTGIVLAHLNICSLRNKINEITQICLTENIHVLALSETHLDSTFENSMLNVDGYRLYRRDRNQNGGGVAFYVKENIVATLKSELMSRDIEVIWLQINLPFSKPTLVGCCYRPPSSNAEYLQKICENMEMVSNKCGEMFLLGDFNIDWFSKKSFLFEKIITMANTCNLKQVMTQPTRIAMDNSSKSACIDHIYTNVPDLCFQAVSIGVGCSDHNLIAITKQTKMPKSGGRIMYRRSYKHFNPNLFIDDIKSSNWSTVVQEIDVNASLNTFMETFGKIVEKHAPLRKRTVKSNSAPWLDEELLSLMKRRDNAKKVASNSKHVEDYTNYRILRNRVTKLNFLKKKEYFGQKICGSMNDSKRLWKVLQELMCKKTKTFNLNMEIGGIIVSKPFDIANHLNDFFINKVEKLRSSMVVQDISSPCQNIQLTMENKACSLVFDTVSEDNVQDLLLSLPDDKTPGIDYIDGKILKIVANVLDKPICHIFNRALISGVFPDQWKQSKIIPLIKDEKSEFTASNCRPVHVLPVLSKIFERLIFNQMLHYFISNDLFTSAQHAYRPGHSTNTALVHMVDQWLTHLDDKKYVGAVLLDFTAAFDVIDHDILLAKLKCYGFSQLSLSLIRNYLNGRTQKVLFNGSLSETKFMSCGVPQGSCLGPLLFSVFVNDMSQEMRNAEVVLYADDATVFCASATVPELNTALQNQLNLVTNWVKLNKLVLNTSKTKCIVFRTKYLLNAPCYLNLRIDNSLVEQVTKTKLLGIKLDDQLSWTDQINHIVSKMGRGIALARRCVQY
uniref:ribonuclease H n=1 Tax=Oryzias sinensis TaxID=183150 RepID=A0A8C7Z1Z2_9TELE